MLIHPLQAAEAAARRRCFAPGLSPDAARNALADWAEARAVLAHFTAHT